MTSSLCFWSILSLDDNLRFLSISQKMGTAKISDSGLTTKDVLLYRSLFDFMHPSEIELAKADIARFLKLKTLAGSVTRCQLKSLSLLRPSFANNPFSTSPTTHEKIDIQNYRTWDIVDIVMYTATENTLLAFFHSAETNSQCSLKNNLLASDITCVESTQGIFDIQDAENLKHTLRAVHEPLMTRAPPLRIFQVIDQASLKPLFVWPFYDPKTSYAVELAQSIGKALIMKEYKSSLFENSHQPPPKIELKKEIPCTRHFYASTMVNFIDTTCHFQRLSIPYGNIVFESCQVTPVYSRETSPMHHSPLSALMDANNLQQEKKSGNIVAGTTLTDTKGFNANEVEPLDACSKSSSPPLSQKRMAALFQKFRIYSGKPKQMCQPQQGKNLEIRQHDVEKKKRVSFRKHQSTNTIMQDTVKICVRCRTSNSPEWRRGPDGNKTLCNACGLRYSRFKSKQWRTSNELTRP
ncbi:uncharacterized protein B0P05DRAFT_169338 [Gilbertella persicaria]|uniref:uncharacterized protein n=1 Tax=Gilbertella persicaria TaxID=101096 RepID=UPI00221E518E|nr:uncharacterized protein B0P05DRAFT_169338 [Gilbertella persicaria]KAI8094977.1 hypothetical protein B0P05DRAFT_169338 [Gilbertella persicaria]